MVMVVVTLTVICSDWVVMMLRCGDHGNGDDNNGYRYSDCGGHGGGHDGVVDVVMVIVGTMGVEIVVVMMLW